MENRVFKNFVLNFLFPAFLRPEECSDSKKRKKRKERKKRGKERKKPDKIASGEKDFDIDDDGTTTTTTSNVDTMHYGLMYRIKI